MHALVAFIEFISSEAPIAFTLVCVCECVFILSLFLLFTYEQRKKEGPISPFAKSYDFLSLRMKRKSIRLRTKRDKIFPHRKILPCTQSFDYN